MNNTFKEYQKHLTLSDRIYIEQSLLDKKSFKEIASFLRKDPTTISKEIKRSSIIEKADLKRCRICKHVDTCQHHFICGDNTCLKLCKHCIRHHANKICNEYEEFCCDKKIHAPYVCNGCSSLKRCPLEKTIYKAKEAQKQYDRKLHDSRTGINLSTEELKALDEIISPLVLRGQPLSHIFSSHGDEIPCSRRTLYNYFNANVLTARNIDLPRKVRYKPRRKIRRDSEAFTQAYRSNRTYKEFERYMEEHPDSDVVELDTVLGRRGCKKRLLTLLFRKSSFMLVFLLPDGNSDSVVNVFDDITEALGMETFQKYFPVILTDNGSEFKNPQRIEVTEDGEIRTKVFYCDPFLAGQKGRLEKNHEYIRYVIPKGKSLVAYTQKDISIMASHINSTARDSLDGRTPFDMADQLLDKKIPALTHLFKVSPDKVMLKPELLKK